MKHSKLLLVVIFQLFLSTGVFAQWLKLPSLAYPPYTVYWEYQIAPAADKTIIYTKQTSVTPSSGGYENAFINTNDLNAGSFSCIGGCSFSPSYNCCSVNSLQSFNDSTFTHITMNQGYYRQSFKIDNSPLRKTVSCPLNNSQVSAISVTNKAAYAISHYSFTNDTMLFVRSDPSQTVKKITQYQTFYQSFARTKLLYLNDSVGYLTVVDKTNLTTCKLLKTDGFGNNWSEIYIDSINKIVDFHFPSENVGYIVRSDSTMFKTIDAGVNWIQLPNTGILSIKCIKFANDTLGYVAGDVNKLSKTVDGGLTWTNEISGTPNTIKSLYAFGDIAYFVDSYNEVYKNKDLTVIGINELQSDASAFNIFPNPANNTFTINTNLFVNQNFSLEIYNLLGEVVYRSESFYNTGTFSEEISLENISNGIYTVSLKNKTTNFNRKLVVTK